MDFDNIYVLYENAINFIKFRAEVNGKKIENITKLTESEFNAIFIRDESYIVDSEYICVYLYKHGIKKICANNNKGILSNRLFKDGKTVVFVLYEAKEKKSIKLSYNKQKYPFNIETVLYNIFAINLPLSANGIKYRLLTEEDIKANKLYNLNTNALPKIFDNDPLIFWYGFKAGSVVHEISISQTCCELWDMRLIVSYVKK